jgi:hypothetical protein
MTKCRKCQAQLSAWEVRRAMQLGAAPCWCGGLPPRISRTLANLAYAELCNTALAKPVMVHDVIRFVGDKYTGDPRYSISVALSKDKRFCWGGRSLYGLARHGLIPGARSLAEAAYAVLLAAPRKLYVEEVDFVLEQLNYRFNSDSLNHHLRSYTYNRWNFLFHMDGWNRVFVSSGRDARHEYNSKVAVCPTHVAFDKWIADSLAPAVERALDERTRRLAEIKGSRICVPGDRIEFR